MKRDGARVLVTGAAGFVGSALCRELARRGTGVRRAVRAHSGGDAGDTVAVGDMGPDTDWREALAGIECAVHLAARTHVLRETARDPLSEYRRANVLATGRLAREAAAAGVRRFVFVSSIKVNGESTGPAPYTESSEPAPEDAYGRTKREAEAVLKEIAGPRMELVVLRPPLVYGPGVKGNFLRLMALVARGTPLPLASVGNRRSLVYLGNLVDALVACIESPAAAGKTYLVSDGEDVSTPELIRRLAAALEVPARLLPCPPALLKLGGAMLGKAAEAARLTGSLEVDSSLIRRELGWRPPYSLDEGLRETARWFKAMRGDTPPPSRPSP